MSRREKRYQNRLNNRISKKLERADKIGTLWDIFKFDKVYKYGKKCCNGVRWKRSVQEFELHLLSNAADCINTVLDGKYEWSKCNHFILDERGKRREIDAPLIKDRLPQKVLTKEVLLKLYTPLLIHNNGASLEGKGLKFSFNQLEKDLHSHYRKYGLNGYVIVTDFSKFFPNANYDIVKKHHEDIMCSEDVKKFLDSTINILNQEKGMPLGIEISQMEMIHYPSSLDNFIKCQLGLKHAGHYMDDYYLIVPPYMNPKEIFEKFKKKAEENHIIISEKKTRIVKFGAPFRFCKTKFIVTETGRIIKHGSRETIKRSLRKIKAFAKRIENLKMNFISVWDSIQSTRNYYSDRNDNGRILKLNRAFNSIFKFFPKNRSDFLEADLVVNEILKERKISKTKNVGVH